MTDPVLKIEDLHLSFPIFRGEVHALNHVSLEIGRGEIVGVVGESGSGKSVTAMLAMRLLPEGSYRIHHGQVKLLGENVLTASEKQLRQWRGAKVAMIFQEPMTALNPTRRIGKQIVEVIRQHQPLSRREAQQKAITLLEEMQIPDAKAVMARYPFELSGGMRQRVMIALAFSCEPELIVADEPTTALDVTVQLQVLRLLKHKARASGTSVLFISHDMAVVSQLCDRVCNVCGQRDRERHHANADPPARASLLYWPAAVRAGKRPAARPASRHPRHGAQPQPASAGMRIPRALLCRRGEMQRNAAPSAHWRRGPTGRLLVSTTGESPCLMYCWNWIACT